MTALQTLCGKLLGYKSGLFENYRRHAGGVERARSYAKRLNAPLAIVDKRRDKPNQAQAMYVIGDVQNKTCVVIDDMIDTAGTIVAGGKVLLEHGAAEIMARPPRRAAGR